MDQGRLFDWWHHQAEIILMCVHWYLRHGVSYQELEMIMKECGLRVAQKDLLAHYSPELVTRKVPFKTSNGSWQMDETYLRVRNNWVYLCRVIDGAGHTLTFMLNAQHDGPAAGAFFQKALSALYAALSGNTVTRTRTRKLH